MRETERSGDQTTRPSVLSFGSPSAVTIAGGNSYLRFSSRCWFSGKSGSPGVCEIVTSPVRVRGMQSSVRQRSVVE